MLSAEVHNQLDTDEVEYMFKLYLLLYADDTVIFAESQQDLQSALNAMHEYCQLWHMNVNTDKTNVVIFQLESFAINQSFTMMVIYSK